MIVGSQVGDDQSDLRRSALLIGAEVKSLWLPLSGTDQKNPTWISTLPPEKFRYFKLKINVTIQ